MSEQKYDLIITSVDPCAELTLLSQKLGKALRINPQQIEFSLNEIASLGGSDYPLLRGTAESKAKQLQAYLKKQGLGSEIRAEISLEAMVEEVPKYTCPACGHRQALDPEGNDTCESCGIIGRKYAAIKKRKDILESERRRHQALQKMGLEQSKNKQVLEEEKRLREEARKKLGIKKEKSPVLLAGLIIVVGVVSVTTYLYQGDKLLSEESAQTEQLAEAATGSAATKKPMLTIPAKGGNITLKMPPAGSAAGAGNGGSTQMAQNVAQSTVATVENMPPLSDNSSQNLALEINQQGNDESLASEAKVKASLVAYSIDSPSSRKAVLQITGGEDATVDQAMVTHIASMEQDALQVADPQFEQMMMLTNDQIAQGNYTQAVSVSANVQDKYQQAVLLHKIIQSEQQQVTVAPEQINQHISKLAKLIWNEADPVKQVRIQGLLSTAYDLSGEKKVASLNLVMAIEKLRFVESNETKVKLLCELSKGQRAIGHISQAREILKFAEDKANHIELASQSQAYAKIVKSYAKAMDFSSAMELTEKINNPALLKETLATVTEIQNDYLSVPRSTTSIL